MACNRTATLELFAADGSTAVGSAITGEEAISAYTAVIDGLNANGAVFTTSVNGNSTEHVIVAGGAGCVCVIKYELDPESCTADDCEEVGCPTK